MASSDAPALHSLGISIFGDNFLVSEHFKFLQDENSRGFDFFSMRPHCRLRPHMGTYGLDESMHIRNYSKPGLTLQELGELEIGNKWLRGWLQETQYITILQVGVEDILRGKRITKKTFKEDHNLILKMVRNAIHKLNALKKEHLETVMRRNNPEELESYLEMWQSNHHFGIYNLPNLKNYPFDGTEWTFEEYNEVRRMQSTYLKNARDKIHLKFTVLSPKMDNPTFSNRADTIFRGYPYMKLDLIFMEAFVDPILKLVAQRYCARCKAPLLPNSLWKSATVIPANGQYSSVHNIPDEIWKEIFRNLTALDVWNIKETCKGLYRIHHESLGLGCVEKIDFEREINRQKVKDI